MIAFIFPTVISHGATSNADATTEPRPRLTNTIGSVQHTSVLTVENRPSTADHLEFTANLHPVDEARTRVRAESIHLRALRFGGQVQTAVSDEKRKGMQVRRIVRTLEETIGRCRDAGRHKRRGPVE